MIYLIDTTAVSDAMADDAPTLARIAAARAADRVVTCSIVRGEVLFGIERLPFGQRRERIKAKAGIAFASIFCEPVPPTAAEAYARVKSKRLAAGLALGDNELWIAATAIALGATLVTRDTDFKGIDDLAIEDWSRS